MKQLTRLRIVHSVYVWHYALLMVHARNDDDDDSELLKQYHFSRIHSEANKHGLLWLSKQT